MNALGGRPGRFVSNLLAVAVLLFAANSMTARAFGNPRGGWSEGATLPVVALPIATVIASIALSLGFAGVRGAIRMLPSGLVAALLTVATGALLVMLAYPLTLVEGVVAPVVGSWVVFTIQWLLVDTCIVASAWVAARIVKSLQREPAQTIAP